MSDIDNTIKERGNTYGDFTKNARITQGLIDVIKDAPNYDSLPDVHLESLHMIFHKVARMVCGDYMYEDNAHDIAGYAKCLEEAIRAKNDKGKIDKVSGDIDIMRKFGIKPTDNVVSIASMLTKENCKIIEGVEGKDYPENSTWCCFFSEGKTFIEFELNERDNTIIYDNTANTPILIAKLSKSEMYYLATLVSKIIGYESNFRFYYDGEQIINLIK